MLEMQSLLKMLSQAEEMDQKDQEYQNYNNDADFSQVLKDVGGDIPVDRKMRYADGQIDGFSFED